MLVKYEVSEKEIIRREKAFLLLSISLLCGSVLASMLFDFLISYLFFLGFALFLFLMNFWLKKFFNKFLKMETYLSKEFLIRAKEKFLIKKINKIKIKRTTNDTIREIGIFFNDGKSLFVNGLDNSKNFEINLLKNVDKKVIIKNIREPIDFDNIFFYPVLGLILSFGSVYLLKLMTDLSYRSLQIILGVSMIYVLLLAIYLLTSKPIKKRY